MHEIGLGPIRTRLFILLLRAFTAAVLFITLVILAIIAYSLVYYPSFVSITERLPIVTRLETYYLIKQDWRGVEILPQTDLSSDFHRFWKRSILLDEQGKVVLDHGNIQTDLIGSIYSKKKTDTQIPIIVNSETVATLLMDSSFMPSERQWTLDFLWPIGMISLMMALPTVIIGLFLMRRFVNPLAEVIAAARAVAGGDLSTRVSSSGPDDLRVLSDSFNHMAESLEEKVNERRNMLADIAHELRTPLTVIRGRLEGVVDGIYNATPEQISPALEETYLLERLVEDLRLLTLVETGQLHFERKLTDLKELVAYVIDIFQAEAEDKHIELACDNCAQSAEAWLDPQRAKQVVGNLVSNAIRYTPENGHINLAVKKENGQVVFTIIDDGPGVPAEDISNLFMRFWRGEKSRSRASGGAGLGLAIARQLVEAQGGQIVAQNRESGGLQITITYPAN